MSYRGSPSYALGGILYDPDGCTNDVPPWGWRCFHCGANFRPEEWQAARRHFGRRFDKPAACQLVPLEVTPETSHSR